MIQKFPHDLNLSRYFVQTMPIHFQMTYRFPLQNKDNNVNLQSYDTIRSITQSEPSSERLARV